MQGPRLCVYRLAREPGKISCLSWIAKNGASCEVVSEWENSNGCALHTDALLSCCWACCCCCLSSKPRPESFELSQISCAELPHALAEPMSSEFRTVTTFSDVNAALVCCCWACCCCCACCTCCWWVRCWRCWGPRRLAECGRPLDVIVLRAVELVTVDVGPLAAVLPVTH